MSFICYLLWLQNYKLGIPIRDMRLLDPNLLTSETGKILVRDNAIVFSMEHVRLIITAEEVIIPMEGFEHNLALQRFNQMLESAIRENHRERAHQRRKFAEEAEFDDNQSDDTGGSHYPPPPSSLPPGPMPYGRHTWCMTAERKPGACLWCLNKVCVFAWSVSADP